MSFGGSRENQRSILFEQSESRCPRIQFSILALLHVCPIPPHDVSNSDTIPELYLSVPLDQPCQARRSQFVVYTLQNQCQSIHYRNDLEASFDRKEELKLDPGWPMHCSTSAQACHCHRSTRVELWLLVYKASYAAGDFPRSRDPTRRLTDGFLASWPVQRNWAGPQCLRDSSDTVPRSSPLSWRCSTRCYGEEPELVSIAFSLYSQLGRGCED